MRGQKKRRVGKDAASEQPRGEPDTRQVQSQIDGEAIRASLRELPPLWFWRECAKAQLRILATNPSVCAQSIAAWRYCICLAMIHGRVERWTGYTAGVIKGHASNAKGSHRWKIRFLQNLVDFVAVWVPLVLREVHLARVDAEIADVEANQPLDGRFGHQAKR